MSVLIRQAKVIDPSSSFHGQIVTISIDRGFIQNIIPYDASAAAAPNEIAQGGLVYISRGWIDVFADYCEPGLEHKETIETGLNAAAAGGFTDVLLSPNTNSVIDNKSSVQYLLQRAKNHAVNLHPLGAISQEIAGKSLAEMLDMRANGAIAFTDGWKPVQNSGLMLKALEYVKAFDGTVIQIPIDTSLAAGGLMNEGIMSTRLGMPGIPILSESLIVNRDIELAAYTDSRLHITGISAAASVDLIRKAKANGVKVTCSVTPYHLALNDEVLQTYDSFYKVFPAIRTEEDRLALVAGLKDGTIDCIATHHHPQDWDAKSKEFEYAGAGMNIQEIAFSILWNAVGEEVGLERIVDALTSAPARNFGLNSEAISTGKPASFTLFTTEENTILKTDSLKSMSANNPFIGKELKGKVLGIFSKGNFYKN